MGTANKDSDYAKRRAQAVADFERTYITETLAETGGNVSQAAKQSGLDRVYLHRLMRKHGVTAKRPQKGGE